ncbi:MAG: hypothetical protein IH872_08695 [Chloroflexi bacterium]|nr:hypothetical protein [Chloroflexota bacterium]
MPRPKKCIFCGGQPLSKEHLLGAWLTPTIVEARLTPPTGERIIYIDDYRMVDGEIVRQNRRFVNNINLTVRCVCVPCNNGWMGDMEKEVKPIIESLLAGKYTLGQDDQIALARWATKTAIIFRYHGSQEVPSMYLDWFYKHQTAPPNTFVWFGTYEGEGMASIDLKDIFILDAEGKRLSFPHAQFVVFTIGSVLIGIFIGFITNKSRIIPSELIRKHLRIIFPYENDVIWPLKPLDEPLRQALVETNWDGGFIVRPSPPTE